VPGGVQRSPLSQLPEYHLRRPRLTGRLTEASVGVVIGGAGYGKSLLATETCDVLGVAAVVTALEPSGVPAEILPLRLRSAAARVGLSDMAARMEQAVAAGPAGELDALLEALAGQPAVVVVDEIQNAEPAAVTLLTRMAGQLGPGQRLLLLGRDAPPGLEPLRRDGSATWLGTADLAMTAEEVAALCQDGFGLPVSAADAARLRTATDGWTAAVVLAASRARSAGEPLLGRGALPGAGQVAGRGGQVLAGLVDQILGSLPRRQQRAMVQAAHLPLLDSAVARAATGVAGLLAAVSRAGLPLQEGAEGWSELIGPVRDLLMARTPASPEVLLRAATEYARRGRPGLAADLLIGVGRPGDAAALLAAMTPQEAERLGLNELVGLVGRLPDAVVGAHPRVLVHIARECEPGAAIHRRAQALHRAMELLGEPPADSAVAREVQTEIARDLVRDDDPAAGEELASRVLAQTGATEEQTRARALDILGRAAARYNDDEHLGFAEDRMTMAARSYRAQGLWTWLAQLLTALGFWVHYERGAIDQAIRSIDDALEVIPDRRQQRAVILTFRAEILDCVGRYDEAAANLDEAEAIALVIEDVRVRAYVQWEWARALSQQGDAAGTLAAVHAAESFRSDWFDGCGGEFLADAADALDRVGHPDLALQYLERARAQSDHEDFEVDRAEAAILARSGDPEAAERALLALSASPWCEPFEQWRVLLLRAVAAHRRGDSRAAALAAESFERAARMGLPGLPLIRERRVAEEVLGLVAATGHPTAAALDAMTFPVTVSLLGGFGVTRGGRMVDVPPGQGRQLVKVVASSGGRLTAEAAMESLWPEADPDASANRLRTVLSRLRESAGDIVVREDRHLRLGPEAQTDLMAFDQNARRALALAAGQPREAVSSARSALARYRGDLLPDDPYEPWAVLPRERLRRHALSLLDLCAAAAAGAGDLDEAVRCLDRAIEISPDEEERYLSAARHLLTQGRRGAARTMVARARRILRDLGLPAPASMLQLEQRVRRA
jgi:DNA-binding SARP family transcriptional activator/ATP/maltotriose-dependent transcriptional regulator MalT